MHLRFMGKLSGCSKANAWEKTGNTVRDVMGSRSSQAGFCIGFLLYFEWLEKSFKWTWVLDIHLVLSNQVNFKLFHAARKVISPRLFHLLKSCWYFLFNDACFSVLSVYIFIPFPLICRLEDCVWDGNKDKFNGNPIHFNNGQIQYTCLLSGFRKQILTFVTSSILLLEPCPPLANLVLVINLNSIKNINYIFNMHSLFLQAGKFESVLLS